MIDSSLYRVEQYDLLNDELGLFDSVHTKRPPATTLHAPRELSNGEIVIAFALLHPKKTQAHRFEAWLCDAAISTLTRMPLSKVPYG